MDTEQIEEQAANEPDIYIFNPTSDDFTHTYDVSGTGSPVPFTIGSRESIKLPKRIADHLAKHLRNRIVGKMPGVITDTIVEEVNKTIYL